MRCEKTLYFEVNSTRPFDGGWGTGLCPGVRFRREGSSLDAELFGI
jgi:hypothetical protein